MDTIEDLLAKKAPAILYHYTSQAGVLGIITSRSLWATSIHYMNDATEFMYAIDQARFRLGLLRDKATSPEEIRFLDELKNVLDNIQGVHVHVFSLSERGDLLSQWRAYCPRGSGFSIGFDPNDLLPLMKTQGFFLVPCVYDNEAQARIVIQMINEALESFRDRLHRGMDKEENLLKFEPWKFAKRFIQVAPALKHPSFSEEREWRMISQPVITEHPQMAYRQGTSMIIPYFVFSLGDRAEQIPIREIVIGPTPHRELSVNSISTFLRRQGLKQWTVGHSQIPYREV